jgi:uncharacterized membrane protein YfcA
VTEILFLSLFSFLAGLIDSIAGGGGLIQLPALFIFLPGLPVATLLGTNKLSSICGTTVAAFQYARHVSINWKATLPGTVAAFIFSFLGARIASLLDTKTMRPIVLALLVGVLIYTFVHREFGSHHAPRLGSTVQFFVSAATGMVVGFYDGFFGPGTGSFLIFIFIGIFGFSFLSASASSKVINFTTNLSAVLYFVFTDNVLYQAALPMAVCNILGSVAGTRLAVLKGNRFVRVLFLFVVSGMIIKLGFDLFR